MGSSSGGHLLSWPASGRCSPSGGSPCLWETHIEHQGSGNGGQAQRAGRPGSLWRSGKARPCQFRNAAPQGAELCHCPPQLRARVLTLPRHSVHAGAQKLPLPQPVHPGGCYCQVPSGAHSTWTPKGADGHHRGPIRTGPSRYKLTDSTLPALTPFQAGGVAGTAWGAEPPSRGQPMPEISCETWADQVPLA